MLPTGSTYRCAACESPPRRRPDSLTPSKARPRTFADSTPWTSEVDGRLVPLVLECPTSCIPFLRDDPAKWDLKGGSDVIKGSTMRLWPAEEMKGDEFMKVLQSLTQKALLLEGHSNYCFNCVLTLHHRLIDLREREVRLTQVQKTMAFCQDEVINPQEARLQYSPRVLKPTFHCC